MLCYQVELQLAALQTEYIDLYYLHAPTSDLKLLTATWRAVEDLQRQGEGDPPCDPKTAKSDLKFIMAIHQMRDTRLDHLASVYMLLLISAIQSALVCYQSDSMPGA